MARKKLAIKNFQHKALKPAVQKQVKGGYRNSPSGANYMGSFIWETIDIRDNQAGEVSQKDVQLRTR